MFHIKSAGRVSSIWSNGHTVFVVWSGPNSYLDSALHLQQVGERPAPPAPVLTLAQENIVPTLALIYRACCSTPSRYDFIIAINGAGIAYLFRKMTTRIWDHGEVSRIQKRARYVAIKFGYPEFAEDFSQEVFIGISRGWHTTIDQAFCNFLRSHLGDLRTIKGAIRSNARFTTASLDQPASDDNDTLLHELIGSPSSTEDERDYISEVYLEEWSLSNLTLFIDWVRL
jgi:hypothetical protein